MNSIFKRFIYEMVVAFVIIICGNAGGACMKLDLNEIDDLFCLKWKRGYIEANDICGKYLIIGGVRHEGKGSFVDFTNYINGKIKLQCGLEVPFSNFFYGKDEDVSSGELFTKVRPSAFFCIDENYNNTTYNEYIYYLPRENISAFENKINEHILCGLNELKKCEEKIDVNSYDINNEISAIKTEPQIRSRTCLCF